jgi:hypothetical protein
MPNARYYRAQSVLLETLSLTTSNPELASEYRRRADDYRRRADEMPDEDPVQVAASLRHRGNDAQRRT